ncbi:MAG: hypothetical protein ACRDSF_00160 [Pseudonocardiaceae bacterium]
MNTEEQQKRARRATALRNKAAATSFPVEAVTFIAKAEELERINANSGYRPENNPFSVDNLLSTYRKQASDEKVRQYQKWVAQHGERSETCICGTVEQKYMGFQCPDHPKKKCVCDDYKTHLYSWNCPTHGTQRSTFADSTDYSGRARQQSAGTRRKSSSHAQCYAEGLHDNTKAGRAACRRGRV